MSRPRKVEILGAGISMGDVPPLDLSPDVERWGTNAVMFRRYGGQFDLWTRWIDLHKPDQIQARRPEAWEWYRAQDGRRPILMWEPHPDVLGSMAYPREGVQQYFAQDGVLERDFWGSLSWMLALAIFERFEEIDLFWFVTDQHQYGRQIPSVRYWIGQARGRGIRVRIHGDSELKPKGPLYGYET